MSNKDFKVKAGLDLGTPLPISMGGTGQTSATNTLNALLPVQISATNKFLSSDGTNPLWAIPAYSYISGAGVSVQSRPTINFVGATVVDDPTNNATNVTISAGTSKYLQVIETEAITGLSIL